MLAQSPKYLPLCEYMMARDAEIALARSAAPDYVSDHATIKVFTASGFQTVHQGDNGFVCVVMRGFTGAPTHTPVQVRDYISYDAKTRAPICLDPRAAANRAALLRTSDKTGVGRQDSPANRRGRTSRLRQRRDPQAPRSVGSESHDMPPSPGGFRYPQKSMAVAGRPRTSPDAKSRKSRIKRHI
jgi:hypothetical protein